MAPLKQLGDLAELKVATDLVSRGYQVAIPFGENNDFDLVLVRGTSLERVQVKHVRSHGVRMHVPCRSSSLTNGKVRKVKRYTAEMIEWLAVYDASTCQCFYIPSALLGAGRELLTLRLEPTKNNQRRGVHYARDFRDPEMAEMSLGMEPAGLEPAASAVQGRRSPN